MDVILSIKPRFVKEIIAFKKSYDFRRMVFSIKYRDKIDKIYIYSTSPEKKIVGYFKMGNIIELVVEDLWRKYKEHAFMNKEEFFRYFNGKDLGYAIEIKDLVVFDIPKEFDDLFPSFFTPRNFSYV